jgi:hypothetical protein
MPSERTRQQRVRSSGFGIQNSTNSAKRYRDRTRECVVEDDIASRKNLFCVVECPTMLRGSSAGEVCAPTRYQAETQLAGGSEDGYLIFNPQQNHKDGSMLSLKFHIMGQYVWCVPKNTAPKARNGRLHTIHFRMSSLPWHLTAGLTTGNPTCTPSETLGRSRKGNSMGRKRVRLRPIRATNVSEQCTG